MKNAVAVVLLALAGAHCTLAIFYDNESWLDLQRYAAGTERNPFQERVAMAPVLRLAAESPRMARWGRWLEQRDRHLHYSTPVGPEEMASLMVAVGCMWGALVLCGLYGRERMPEVWWLPGATMLAMLYASYAARYEHALWYPYDMPHMLLFGAACACLLTGRPWWALLFFALDVPVRETSIYLVPLSACLGWGRLRWKSVAGYMALGVTIWAAIRVPIMYVYRHNPTEVGSRLARNLHALASPADWPTLASTAGFLLAPVWLGRRRLDGTARAFLWLSLPCLAVSAYFGILIETRVFVEWTIPFALLAATEGASLFASAAGVETRRREAHFAG
jgi:hypothetical protein